MWAIMVGAIASRIAAGTGDDRPGPRGDGHGGPLLCAFSQVVNDHFDRDVDRINEPLRPTAANQLGRGRSRWSPPARRMFARDRVRARPDRRLRGHRGMLLALAYSAPPLRLKARDGWLANTACAFSYEGLAWIAGSAAFGTWTTGTTVLAVLYSLGAHGLMTLNDFKSIDGDRALGCARFRRPRPEGGDRAGRHLHRRVSSARIAYVATQRAWIAAAAMTVLLLVQIHAAPALDRPRGLARGTARARFRRSAGRCSRPRSRFDSEGSSDGRGRRRGELRGQHGGGRSRRGRRQRHPARARRQPQEACGGAIPPKAMSEFGIRSRSSSAK